MRKYKNKELLSYGILGLPIAFVGLPIYVHAPKFYADSHGVSLALLGTLLLLSRLVDTVQDPLIGYYSDKLKNKISRQKQILCALPLLGIFFYGLFNAPNLSENGVLAWFIITLIFLYTSFSIITINYYSIGAEMSDDYNEKTKITSFRESFVFVGVIIAAALPQVLTNTYGTEDGFAYFSLIFIPVLLVCGTIMFRYSPRAEPTKKKIDVSFKSVLKNKKFIWLLSVVVFNSIAGAIPATLILFFAQDVLEAESYSGYFLVVYFLCAVMSVPFWYKISLLTSKKTTLIMAMFLAIISFVWAFALGSGDINAFFIISSMSGFALGADYAISPSILADIIDDAGHTGEESGSYFGIWNFVAKLNLALAAGITLPLLGAAGYYPGEDNSKDSLWLLSFSYGLLPCAFKCIALLLLWISPIDRRAKT